jgi:multiple sugar transport system permease protein
MVVHYRKKIKNSYVLIIVALLLIYYSVICIWPLVFNIIMSMYKTDLMTSWKFVGAKNYLNFFKDPINIKASINNIIYMAILVSIGIGTSLIIAALIHRVSSRIVQRIYIAMFFAPVITSLVAVSLIWRLLYFPNIGIFAKVISAVLHVKPPTFLADPQTALISIIIMDIWKDTGLRTVIFHTAMDEIPQSIYDSANIDGASEVSFFFRITIPMISPHIVFLAAIYSINSLTYVFRPVFIMSGYPPGGPAHSTQVLVVRMYQVAFRNLEFGKAAVIAMVIFILLFGLVLLEIKSFQRR